MQLQMEALWAKSLEEKSGARGYIPGGLQDQDLFYRWPTINPERIEDYIKELRGENRPAHRATAAGLTDYLKSQGFELTNEDTQNLEQAIAQFSLEFKRTIIENLSKDLKDKSTMWYATSELNLPNNLSNINTQPLGGPDQVTQILDDVRKSISAGINVTSTSPNTALLENTDEFKQAVTDFSTAVSSMSAAAGGSSLNTDAIVTAIRDALSNLTIPGAVTANNINQILKDSDTATEITNSLTGLQEQVVKLSNQLGNNGQTVPEGVDVLTRKFTKDIEDTKLDLEKKIEDIDALLKQVQMAALNARLT
jgi:hypothetical protein